MDEEIERLKTPAECDAFAKSVEAKNPELGARARRRAVELRAAARGYQNSVEKELLEAVYAYEEVLSRKRGRRTSASRTWQMISRHGIIRAAERAVARRKDPSGYTALVEMGMQDLAFEAVVIRHPGHFGAEAVGRARQRLASYAEPNGVSEPARPTRPRR